MKHTPFNISDLLKVGFKFLVVLGILLLVLDVFLLTLSIVEFNQLFLFNDFFVLIFTPIIFLYFFNKLYLEKLSYFLNSKNQMELASEKEEIIQQLEQLNFNYSEKDLKAKISLLKNRVRKL